MNSVVYQIYPKSFKDSNGDGIGDIKGIQEKLPYLEKLGIDVLWISPMYPSPGVDNGYDVSDYYGIDPMYGTMEDMKNLIRECENHNIKIIIDLVVNHTSDEHEWFIEAKTSKNSTYRDYYIWRKGVGNQPPNDLESNFGGSAWEYSEETEEYYLHFYSKKQPDLNWENPNMRNEIWKMMNFWIDLGIGGFRMDVIDLIGKQPDQKIKENGPKLHDYLQEMNAKTFGNSDLLTVGECWGATPEIATLYSAPERKELSMIFQFEQINLDKIAGKQRWDLKPLYLPDLKRVFSKWQTEMEGKGWNSLFWSNHDLPRIVSRWGNAGKYRIESAKMLATLLHGMKGTPYIFQGEELGMTNADFNSIADFKDIESRHMAKLRLEKGEPKEIVLAALKKKARDNARTPMQWDDSYAAGFTSGTPWLPVNKNYITINAKQSLDDKQSIFYYYQSLIKLRKAEETLVHGIYELLLPNDENIYAYTRSLGTEKLLIICNFYETEQSFSYNASAEIILSNYNKNGIINLKQLVLAPYESFILRLPNN